MATVRQSPGALDILMVWGDDFTFILHSSIDLSGYTLEAWAGATPLTVSPTVGMTTGYYYDVTITSAQSDAFTGDRTWVLAWTDPETKKRTAIAGVIRQFTT